MPYRYFPVSLVSISTQVKWSWYLYPQHFQMEYFLFLTPIIKFQNYMHQLKLCGRNLFRVLPIVQELRQNSSFGTLRKFFRTFLGIRDRSPRCKCKNLKDLSRCFLNLNERVLVAYVDCATILKSLQLIYI